MSQEDKDHAIWAIMFKSDNTLQGPMMNRDTSKVRKEEKKREEKESEEEGKREGIDKQQDSEENRKLRTSLRDLVLSRFGSSYPVLRSLVPLTPLSKIRVLNGYDKVSVFLSPYLPLPISFFSPSPSLPLLYLSND